MLHVNRFKFFIRTPCCGFSTKGKPKASAKSTLKTFDELFGNVQTKKISSEGTFDSLYQECMSEIYKRRAEIDSESVEFAESPEIAELTAKELQITRSIFKRVDPMKKLVPRLENNDDYIDPYWDPFQKLEKLKIQIASEFNDLVRLVSSAEARKHKRQIREAMQTMNKFCDPYAKETDVDPNDQEIQDPKYLHERFWDPDVDRRLVLQNNKRPFCWRDLHVLHHFVAENGQILPRRLTFATRQQQRQIFKAIKFARQMALFPYDWRPRNRDRIPLMDPRQVRI
ncbi:bifunctional Ribosomal protein S18/Ribosomal protein S18 superfamily [Babesia duncani]|uniref:Bifunctional Ribosomal protein S18/Ribosomal protein S18 superfamily n=1 Tax=Babesia duncani TaxID=323732 RepID=A0AAD9PJ03_9APIC|nr:bifunctional Ribosomal protein S18/Ribosomal protein S18 superfamily [Babesia duncani]